MGFESDVSDLHTYVIVRVDLHIQNLVYTECQCFRPLLRSWGARSWSRPGTSDRQQRRTGPTPQPGKYSMVQYLQQLKGLCPRDIVSYPLNNRDYFASLGGVVMPNATPQTVR